MKASDGILYLFGHGGAIRAVAQSRSALWTGAVLVLITAVARNYDQTHFTEKPGLWLFGPLLFSVVSGTWLYAIVYGGFARREMGFERGRPAFWSGWAGFMGLFWMTAPIAWLYAIPVERFLDSLTATKANLVLLAAVSTWRVLLMARVMQQLTTAHFLRALSWVLLAAAVEVLVVFFFSGQFARRIMSAMGGMRNSPEEDLLMNALGATFTWCFFGGPVVLLLALLWRERRALTPLPATAPARMPWIALAVGAVIWVGVAILPQRELANTVAVERLVAKGEARAALDYLSARSPGDFAPARPLPPKPFEREIFTALPAYFDVVQPADAPWVRAFLLRRLDEMIGHYGPRWARRRVGEPRTRAEKLDEIATGLSWLGPEGHGLLKLLNGLDRLPEGRDWLRTNPFFLEALQKAVTTAPARSHRSDRTDLQREADWRALSNRLGAWVPGASPSSATNESREAPTPR